MHKNHLFFKKISLLLLFLILLSWKADNIHWNSEKYPSFEIHYTIGDSPNKSEYIKWINEGVKTIAAFFQAPYKKHFDVFIQPDRTLFDKAYQENYKQPGFRSECWLVATGDGYRINILSTKVWAKEPCDTRYSEYTDKIKTQKLMTHELVHVFHGQLNKDPALNNGSGMDWFAEGLAFYVSGQLDASGVREVKKAIAENKVPAKLDSISTFNLINLRYDLSGSIVSYIDKTYGREKLKRLLIFTKKSEVLAALKTTEPRLLLNWRGYVQKH